ncbi:glycosyltransferase [Enterococcus casseliflavus]|uniref:Glycosyl transferase family 1 domain-containing protein n=1 Tax=Enterococcus diestrammenae TaxID=1155073 RepID=A0ABV0F002_9ENTE|nr:MULTISPECIES: glycosyltransferase [Enterococcus]KAF1296636.1 hypothetical protein BAU18_06385 [Enterococcus diestrammenae]MBO6357951.1 glycosyltransferase [Enterococcus casseliflavus]MBO6375597.1 glycosyltransferase [Enterococcus casseliflavus]
MSRIVVAHAGKQHSFKTAEYLIRGGHSVTYITTVYDKKGSVTDFIKRFLGSKNLNRANGRKSKVITDEQVLQFFEIFGLISLLLMRIDKTRFFYTRWNKLLFYLFSRKVAMYCKKNNVDILIMYDGQAAETFKRLQETNVKVILDMSAASLPYMKKIYEKDIIINPKFSDNLKKYTDFIFDESNQKKARQEIELSTSILVPSKFSLKSLTEFITDPTKIKICPYGFEKVDSTILNRNESGRKDCLNIVFTGTVNQRKGISYLLEAVDELREKYPEKTIRLTLIGKYDEHDPILIPYTKTNNFVGMISHDSLLTELVKNDLFVFPSLSDSFAFSVIEALSVGLPVICSNNTGASDFISNGENGHIFETQNKNHLMEILELYLINNEKLEELKVKTKMSIESLSNTWDAYGANLLEIVNEVEQLK